MNYFLQKLRRRVRENDEGSTFEQSDLPEGATQLPIDVYQNDTEIIVYAQVPGIAIDSLDVSIEGDNDVVTVQGETRRPKELVPADTVSSDGDTQEYTNEYTNEDGSKQVHIHVGGATHKGVGGEFSFEECVWGSFFRQIILPAEIDPNKAEAKTKDGVLMLRLPFKEPSGTKMKLKITNIEQY